MSEREELLHRSHPLFKTIDAGFQIYIEVVSTNSSWQDDHLEEELRKRGVEPNLAEELVAFVPMAFGREIVHQVGLKCHDNYVRHNLNDGSEQELPLNKEMVFAWAKAMIGEYRTAERNEVFKLIACRSSELNAVNNALNSGMTVEGLQTSTMGPTHVFFRTSRTG
jgi:hypothetical protein